VAQGDLQRGGPRHRRQLGDDRRGDKIIADTLLGPLVPDGHKKIYALQSMSPALGLDRDCREPWTLDYLLTDQRDVVREWGRGPLCDAGAYELSAR
jgi:hypothetical protein